MTSLTIIVPTYCESRNLRDLVRRIDLAVQLAGISSEILIVDDNSPDDTAAVCESLDFATPTRLIVRKSERGLSSAVMRGMDEATGDILLVMDADLSHPPEVIPAIVAAIREQDCEFVIGSRYVKGGSTAGDWGLLRWLNSKAATLMARPLTSAQDPMAGYFAIHRSRFVKHRQQLDPIGYKIGLELIVKCGCGIVREIPIHFSDRAAGESKLTLKEQLNYVRHLKRLYEFRFHEYARLTKFLLVGASGMVVDLSIFTILLMLAPDAAARAIAIWAAMTWNFTLNRSITFTETRSGSVVSQYAKFCCSCLLGASINWSISLALLQAFPEGTLAKLLAAVSGVIAGTGFNYLLCRRFVFSDDQPVADHSGTLRRFAGLFVPVVPTQPKQLVQTQSAKVHQASVSQ
ncbi:MAG: glycosyltransferase family 2 protein [Planctomycetota bacterium]|nr:glycosyltransferase family 2 protein [Planctomycetota bacterium]